jgi:hypothetical protein
MKRVRMNEVSFQLEKLKNSRITPKQHRKEEMIIIRAEISKIVNNI